MRTALRPDWIHEVPIPSTHMSLLFYDDNEVRFKHICKDGSGDAVITAPILLGHRIWEINQGTPHASGVFITPSIWCPGCDLHGFVTAGRWIPA